MTDRDIERIENFMTKFDLSMNDIFCILVIGVCELGITRTDETEQQLYAAMDNYIYEETQEIRSLYHDM